MRLSFLNCFDLSDYVFLYFLLGKALDLLEEGAHVEVGDALGCAELFEVLNQHCDLNVHPK
jgi:hypothetical protein